MLGTQIGLIAEVHSDERRTISEFNGEDTSVQNFVVHEPGLPLGEHYHERKRETFVILEGGGLLLLAKVNKNRQMVGKIRQVPLEAGSVVVIDKMVAHTFFLRVGSRMICLSSEPFNPDDMDLNAFPLAAEIDLSSAKELQEKDA